MKSIKFKNVEWFYDTEEELNKLKMLDIMEQINIVFIRLQNEQMLRTSSFFSGIYIPNDKEYTTELRQLIRKFNDITRMLYKKSKGVSIHEVDTIKNKVIIFY
jgi:hypothetical protein